MLQSRRFLLWCLPLVIIVAVLLGMWASRGARPLTSSERIDLRLAVQAGNLAKAQPLLARGLATEPADGELLVAAGDVAMLQEQPALAIGYYERAQLTPEGDVDRVRFALAEALRVQGRLSDAERQLLAIQDQRQFPVAERMAFVLTSGGRRRSALPWLQELIASGRSHLGTLLMVADLERPALDAAYLKQCQQAAPEDPLTRLAAGVEAVTRNDWTAATQALAGAGEFPEAEVLRGEVLLAEQKFAEFATWQQMVSPETEATPELWVLRGRWATEMRQLQAAVRCYCEALRRDINSRSATYRLGQELVALGEKGLAEPWLARARLQEQLSGAIEQLHRSPGDLVILQQLAESTAQLGRLWESAGWARVAQEVNPAEPWVQAHLAALEPRLTDAAPWTILAVDPRAGFPIGRFPFPEWPAITAETTRPAVAAGNIRFRNIASEAGVDFTYFEAPDPTTEGRRILETAGGGIAALDYDGDGWPDLYFTQGCPWPAKEEASPPLDRLFRNVFGERGEDVTERAGVREDRFGQGVTAGDFDNDGFADLYVANVGLNRLYRNQGDGTFADVTAQLAGLDETWTASVAMADLTGDGLPDLFDVTYLEGDDVHTRICVRNGRPRVCDPGSFPAASDRCFVNQGDGRFTRWEDSASGLSAADGKGLGLVIADLTGSAGLDVFVANDGVPNHVFLNQTTDPALPRFQESALDLGLAVDADGRPQACMGVAAGDANGDGRLDLLVTNYYQESNTLYQQVTDGVFADETRAAQLRDPGYLWLGFGTQFLDADLDGQLDLIVANGHLDDFTADGQPYTMPTQVLRNAGSGRYVEVAAQELGPWFEQPRIGRSVVTLDWNRDGRPDAAVGTIGEPSALLLNESTAGNSVVLTLVGVSGPRVPIGTRLVAEAGGQRQSLQLTAGDGYQASNEKRVLIGLGAATQVDRVTLVWPGGVGQSLGPLAAGEYRVVEGREPVRLEVVR